MKGAITMKRMALAAAICLSALSLFAYDLSGTSLTQKDEKTEDGKTVAILVDESGAEFLFEAESEPSAERLSALQSLVAEIRSWDDFQVAELRAVNMSNRLQVTAIPRQFLVEGVDLAPAIPGGIQLFYKTATEYDFKVRSGKFAVRVGSVFTGIAELGTAALAAFKDPTAFIATRDPLYVQKRLDELLDIADAFEARIAALEKVTFDTNSGDALAGRTSKAENDLAELKDEVLAYEAKADGRNEELEARQSAEAAQWARARAAIVAALNGGKAIKAEPMAKLIELKKADPALDRKSAPKALKDEGFILSPMEISAIFLAEFGE